MMIHTVDFLGQVFKFRYKKVQYSINKKILSTHEHNKKYNVVSN